VKRMSRFMPTTRRPRAEADDHYVMVHHRFAMRMFRDAAPTVTHYATNHAVAQLDLAGTFRQIPTDAWRFIVLEFAPPTADSESGTTGGKEWLPAWAERAIVNDHTNFLREVRPFEVTPEVRLDRRRGQTSLAKFLIEVEDTGAGPEATGAALDEIRAALAGPEVFGYRLHIANTVAREAEMAAVTEPGQAYTGRYRDTTTMAGIDELYFDHLVWGEEFFASAGVRAAFAPRAGVRAGVYAVTELVGVDRN
jgi:hypothetical protein